jgi:ATP-dependent Clp protease ATP-binding subunit ClpA
MFDRFSEAAHDVMDRAGHESDRLQHNYIGGEHLLVAIAEQPTGLARGLLSARRLDAAVLRDEVQRLVAAGVLPPPTQSDAELLRMVGVDLDQVARALNDTFGSAAVDDAVRQVSRRSGWTPLCGKALVVKQAFWFAALQADALGQADVEPEHLLLGILRDARNPIDKPRCFRNPWQRRRRAHLGLHSRGPNPVRLIVEARGLTLDGLHEALVTQLRDAS